MKAAHKKSPTLKSLDLPAESIQGHGGQDEERVEVRQGQPVWQVWRKPSFGEHQPHWTRMCTHAFITQGHNLGQM